MTSHGGILREDHAGTRTGSREGPTGAAGAPRPLGMGGLALADSALPRGGPSTETRKLSVKHHLHSV